MDPCQSCKYHERYGRRPRSRRGRARVTEANIACTICCDGSCYEPRGLSAWQFAVLLLLVAAAVAVFVVPSISRFAL